MNQRETKVAIERNGRILVRKSKGRGSTIFFFSLGRAWYVFRVQAFSCMHEMEGKWQRLERKECVTERPYGPGEGVFGSKSTAASIGRFTQLNYLILPPK